MAKARGKRKVVDLNWKHGRGRGHWGITTNLFWPRERKASAPANSPISVAAAA
jgi:hypothetical protein